MSMQWCQIVIKGVTKKKKKRKKEVDSVVGLISHVLYKNTSFP